MTKSFYDIHVATDDGGKSAQLSIALGALGFEDDQLAQRGLVFPSSTEKYYDSCPLIDIHMSKKLNTRSIELENKVEQLVRDSGCAGYWHGEKTIWDASIESPHPIKIVKPTFRIHDIRPRDQNKLWDLHIAIAESDLSSDLRQHLVESGLYFIVRNKIVGPVSIFTVQGVNEVSEGLELARHLIWWLVISGVPRFDFKFEITTSMNKINNPQLVPPTIDRISWES